MHAATVDLAALFAQRLASPQLELPMLPGVAAEVLSLTQLDSTDAARLSAVIHRDQTLASNVLRVANSPSHAGQVPIASLQQAVGRLGLQLITEIAMAVSVRAKVFSKPHTVDLLAQLWRHSVLVGFYTKEIARMRRRNVEVAFLCGLLHDIGKAVLLDDLDRVFGADEVQLNVGDLAVALHEHHGAAGALLAQQWRLPDQITEAILCHHDYAAASRFQDTAMTVALADLLAHQLSPNDLDVLHCGALLRDHPLLAALNLYQDQLDQLLGKGEQAMAVAEGMR
jgi:putative nucleotidyltransferase with HDIG domain